MSQSKPNKQQKSNITVHLAWNAIGIYLRVLLINMCIVIGFSRIVHLRKGNVTDTIKKNLINLINGTNDGALLDFASKIFT